MQEIAQTKDYNAKAQHLAQRQQQFLQLQQQAQQGGNAATPSQLRKCESDPIAYMEAKMNYDEAKAQYDQHMTQVYQMQQVESDKDFATKRSFKQEQAKLLVERIPEIVDPDKGDKLKKDWDSDRR